MRSIILFKKHGRIDGVCCGTTRVYLNTNGIPGRSLLVPFGLGRHQG